MLNFIKKLLGIKNGSYAFNDTFVKSKHQINIKNVNYSTPTFDLNNSNVIHSELKAKKEIEDLYAEIRFLQDKNREKINKNKFSYNIR